MADGSPTDRWLDWFVYAPLGAALEAKDLVPKWVARGRGQVGLLKVAGTMAQRRGSTQLAGLTGQIVEAVGDLLAPEPSRSGPGDGDADGTGDEDRAGDLPLAGYDDLPAAEIVRRVADLTPAERDVIRRYETATRSRVTVLKRLDQLDGR